MDNMLNKHSFVSDISMPAFGALSALNKMAYLCPLRTGPKVQCPA